MTSRYHARKQRRTLRVAGRSFERQPNVREALGDVVAAFLDLVRPLDSEGAERQ